MYLLELDFVYSGKLVSLVYWHGLKVDLAQYHQKFIQLSIGRERTTMLDWTDIGITKYKINNKPQHEDLE